MGIYKSPSKNLHRGFIYLDDEVVVNSLSSFEAGKVDEVVAKAVIAREGGGGIGAGFSLGAAAAKAEVTKKGSSTMEEAITRTRTRFSIFSAWYDKLTEEKAIGRFDGWGPEVLEQVVPGETVEIRAEVNIVPIYGLLRMFLWFADKAGQKGHPLAQSGQELAETKSSVKNVKLILGEENSGVIVEAVPEGGVGPRVAMNLSDEWLVQPLGSVGGECTIIGQVQRIIRPGEWLLTRRLFEDGPPTDLERQTIQATFTEFTQPAQAFGLVVDGKSGEIEGPAVWLDPIAIFR